MCIFMLIKTLPLKTIVTLSKLNPEETENLSDLRKIFRLEGVQF